LVLLFVYSTQSTQGDLVVIDTNNREVAERNIYVVKYKGQTLLRYVTRYDGPGLKGYFLNAIDPGCGTAFLRPVHKKDNSILGRVLWVLKSLMGPQPGRDAERLIEIAGSKGKDKGRGEG